MYFIFNEQLMCAKLWCYKRVEGDHWMVSHCYEMKYIANFM